MKKPIKKILTIICFLGLLLGFNLTFANEQKNEPKEDSTLIITNYLDKLRRNNVFGAEEFKLMQKALLESPPRLINPMPEKQALISSITQNSYWDTFERIVEHVQKFNNITDINIDYQKILTKVKQLIYEIENNEDKREEACTKTENINVEMDFVTIPTGNYETKFLDKPFEITDDIEIQTTPVTQYQWAKIMNYNPSHFNTEEKARKVDINGKELEMNPNRPVENVSYKDITKFIGTLNEQDKDYEYHLPSIEEYLAVLGLNSQMIGSVCLNKDETCHIDFNSYIDINNKRIYSILDNVQEFTRDSIKFKRENLTPKNNIIFGLPYYSSNNKTDKLSSITRVIFYKETSDNNTGFRLIRYKKSSVPPARKSYNIAWDEEIIRNDKNYIWDQVFQIPINNIEHLDWIGEHKDHLPNSTQHTFNVLLERYHSIENIKTLENLDLYNNNITDLTPLAGLTKLEKLNIVNNNITDLNPLAGLIKLIHLDLNNNNITDITPLDGLTELLALTLTNNNITDLTPLAGLTKIYSLWLNNNSITDLTPLAGLTKLEYLYLGLNKITDLTPLAGLRKLWELTLSNNNINDLNPLTGLTNLLQLKLSNNNITDLTPLAGLRKLGVLHLRNNNITDLTPLAGLTLVNLDLRNNNITDLTPLAGLTKLESLNLDNNNITDLTPLAGLTKLESLNLDNNNITNLNPLNGLTELLVLAFNDNNITDLTPLAGLTKIGGLWLNNNSITDLTPLAGLKNIKYLDLNDSNITDLNPLTGLTNLSRIYLNNNNITDLTPLAGLRNLQWLGLDNNKITDLTPLAGLTKIGGLWLNNNSITDLTPLAGLKNIKYLDLNDSNIIDLNPLAGLTKLSSLDLGNNNITDITPLDGLTKLKWLYIKNNPITDYSPLEKMEKRGGIINS